MTRRTRFTIRPHAALLVLLTAATFAPAFAADRSTAGEDRARYLRERAVCTSGQSQQDRATCLKEAAAAYAEARKGGLDTGTAGSTRANQLERCEALPAPERKDCLARMQGGGTTSGSAATGGIYRELVTREVGPAASAAASAAAPTK